MPDRHDQVLQAIKDGIEDLALLDEEGDPARIVVRDKAKIDTQLDSDNMPFIMVSLAEIDETGDVFSATRTSTVYASQVTFVNAGDQSQEEARGIIRDWQESVWDRFSRMQPWPIEIDNLYRVFTRGSQPLDDRGWRGNYTVFLFFVFVELIETPG